MMMQLEQVTLTYFRFFGMLVVFYNWDWKFDRKKIFRNMEPSLQLYMLMLFAFQRWFKVYIKEYCQVFNELSKPPIDYQ